MYKISIIIPVYNVEKYILKTIESVINQTYYNTEIILVDDGSTDNSSKICDEFSKRDNRICVIHQENQGLSAARNIGTNLATGDFVFYLDGDDYLENDALENLIALSDNCDLVIGNYYYTYSDHEDIAQPDTEKIREFTRKEAISQLMQGKLQTFAWGKLIRADIARNVLAYGFCGRLGYIGLQWRYGGNNFSKDYSKTGLHCNPEAQDFQRE